jgi:hypothetical protein
LVVFNRCYILRVKQLLSEFLKAFLDHPRINGRYGIQCDRLRVHVGLVSLEEVKVALSQLLLLKDPRTGGHTL